MKKEYIFSARDLYEMHPSSESWKFWVMKYIEVLTEEVDYVERFSFRQGVKSGIKRKDFILTQSAADKIKKRTEKLFAIYALKCPIENVVKYVGCSVNVYSRVAQIFSDFGNQRKLEWAKYLREKGLKPEIIILEECSTFDEAVICEQKHITDNRETIFNSKAPVLYRNNTINNWRDNLRKVQNNTDMLYPDVIKLIKILEKENLSENIIIEEKEFNIEWIQLLKKSINTAFKKKNIRDDKRYRKSIS